MYTAVMVGLEPHEVVVRGGCLKQPAIMSGLRVLDGLQFCKFSARNPVLVKFLSGNSVCKSPFSASRLCDVLKDVRDRRVQEMCTQVVQGPPQDVPVDDLFADEQSPTDSGSAASTPSAKRLRGPCKRAVLAMHPHVTVDFCYGETQHVEMRILCEDSCGKAPCFEATQANFAALYEWFAREAPERRARAAATVSAERPAKSHPPTRTADGTVYFRKDRMCFFQKARRPETHQRNLFTTRVTGKLAEGRRKGRKPRRKPEGESPPTSGSPDRTGSSSPLESSADHGGESSSLQDGEF